MLVVGGGVAGLSAAISLGRRGAKVTVVDERGEAPGASLIVGHGAVHALEALGVLDACLEVGAHIRADEPSWWTRVYGERHDDAAGRALLPRVGARMERRRIDDGEARQLVRAAVAEYEGSTMFAEIAERVTEDVTPIVAPFEWIWVPLPWHRGRVVLVGDAAHATTPNIAAAGGMAIEDGVVLAEELERSGELEAGLAAYEARRLERTKLVVDASVEVMLMQQRMPRKPMDEAAVRAAAIEKLAEPY